MSSLKSTLYIEREQHLCALLQPANNLKPNSMGYELLISESHDFWRVYTLFVARPGSIICAQMLRGTQINYMRDKSHVIIIIVITQGQIVQIYFIRKDCLT